MPGMPNMEQFMKAMQANGMQMPGMPPGSGRNNNVIFGTNFIFWREILIHHFSYKMIEICQIFTVLNKVL